MCPLRGRPPSIDVGREKHALVVAAVANRNRVPPFSAGSLRDDLLACARTFVRNERTQRVLAGPTTAMVHDRRLPTAAHGRSVGRSPGCSLK